jgi:DnaD/phage-associated family protein
MQGFGGFPRKGRLIRIPGLFFSDLLPQIDHLGELKVTLYCFWRLQQQKGQRLYIRASDMAADRVFMAGLGVREEDQHETLREGLERAVARGTLLHAHFKEKGRITDLYFVNTDRGRAMIEAIEKGEWQAGDEPKVLLDLSVERPTIFTLYEQNVGPLTPLLSDRLRDLEETYSEDWLSEAIQIAVKQNARNLRYIEAILRRWQEEGRIDVRDMEVPKDYKRYISGKYKDEIES